jgi:hypothetical protein
MKDAVGDHFVERGIDRQALMDAEPLAGMPMPLNIEAVRHDPIQSDKTCAEFFAAIVVEAGAVTPQEAVFATVPFYLDLDGVVELRWVCRSAK